jgi:GYF domain 2
MADAVWYFAIDEEERGPVTEAQLRTLIGTGNLSRDDLVWREGLNDWVPAWQVPGLFDKEVGSRAADAASPSTAEKRPAQATAPAARPATVAPATFATPAASAPREAHHAFAFSKPLHLFQHVNFLGQPLLLTGFMLVLLSRGCDAVATHYAERLQAKAVVAESRFKDEWDAQKAALEKPRQQAQDHKPQTPADQKLVESLDKQLATLEETKQAEEAELREGKWRVASNAARDAGPNNKIWGFWRATVFWLGTVAFSLGLWVVGFNGDGSERWLSLAMLAVIVYSLYTGGPH